MIKPPIRTDDPVWSNIELASIYERISVDIKRALAHAEPIVRYANGDWNAWSEIETLLKSTIHEMIEDSSSNPPVVKIPKDEDGSTGKADGMEVSRIRVTGNILSRYAEVAEDALVKILRGPIAELLGREKSDLMDKQVTSAGFPEKVGMHPPSTWTSLYNDFGVGMELYKRAIDLLTHSETAPNYPRSFQVAATNAFEYLERESRQASCPPIVRRAYEASRFIPSEKAPVLGVLPVDLGDGLTQRVPFYVKGGLCHALSVAVKMLSVKYSWTEESALIFLLASTAVPTKAAKIEYDIRASGVPGCTSRVILTLDPSLSEKEVLRIYRLARKRVTKPDSRGKGSSDARLILANNIYSRSWAMVDDRQGYWPHWMAYWNTEARIRNITGERGQEPMTYSKLPLFKLHAKQTRDKLLNPGYVRPETVVEYPAAAYITDGHIEPPRPEPPPAIIIPDSELFSGIPQESKADIIRVWEQLFGEGARPTPDEIQDILRASNDDL